MEELDLSERLLIETLLNGSKEKGCFSDEVKNIKRLTGDASSRKYYRVTTSGKSLVVCLSEPLADGSKPQFVQVQKAFKENGVTVPEILDEDDARGYLLQEDLGDQTLLLALAKSDSIQTELKTYEAVLEELLRIHRIPATKYPNNSFTTLSFDNEKLMWEMKFTVDLFLRKFLNNEIDSGKEQEILGMISPICEKLAQQDKVVTHRDFHSRNIMCINNEYKIIDFQDARMGVPQYDLVSLLEDCYYELDDETKAGLMESYRLNLPSLGITQSNDEFTYLYDLMTFQRVFKALGSFAYIYRLRGDERYIKYIGFGFEKVKALLYKHKEFNDLRIQISEMYYGH